MLHIDWVEDPRIFTDSNDEWESLLADRAYRPPFLRPLWMRIWWEHHSGEYDLRILRVRDQDGRLAGLAPLCKKRNPPSPLEWIGGVETSDVQDFIIRPGMETQVLEAMSLGMHSAVDKNGGLDLHFIPDGSPTLFSDHKIFKNDWDLTIEKEETSPWAPLKETWDEYLMQLRGKDRHEVRRKIKKLDSNLNPAFRILKSEDGLDEAIGAFFSFTQNEQPRQIGIHDRGHGTVFQGNRLGLFDGRHPSPGVARNRRKDDRFDHLVRRRADLGAVQFRV